MNDLRLKGAIQVNEEIGGNHLNPGLGRKWNDPRKVGSSADHGAFDHEPLHAIGKMQQSPLIGGTQWSGDNGGTKNFAVGDQSGRETRQQE